MTKFKFLLMVAFLTSVVSCSDFFNSNDSGAAADSPEFGQGAKPFPPGFDPNSGTFTDEKMLANIGLFVIAPQAKQLRLESELLLINLQKWLKSLNSSDGALNKDLAQKSWNQTMLAFHTLDAVPVGPLSSTEVRISEQIYSWPYMNICGVDHEVVARRQLAPDLFTLKGLAAIEYLLFEKNLTSECNPRNPRNQIVVDWTLKPNLEKEKDRATYAVLVAQDLLAKTRQLENLWDPTSLNYTMLLVNGSLYPRMTDAVNAMSDSLFNIERVKDLRLAKPLGLHKECESLKCPEATEHLYSGIAIAAIEARIRGFQSAFFGESADLNGFGFDDSLKQMGREDVAFSMKRNLDQFFETLETVKQAGSLKSQIEQMDSGSCNTAENVGACVLFQNLRLITTKMKTEFLVALSLKAPPTYQGDND